MRSVIQLDDTERCHRVAVHDNEIDALHPNRAKVLPKATASRLHMHKMCEAHLSKQGTVFGGDTFKDRAEPTFDISYERYRDIRQVTGLGGSALRSRKSEKPPTVVSPKKPIQRYGYKSSMALLEQATHPHHKPARSTYWFRYYSAERVIWNRNRRSVRKDWSAGVPRRGIMGTVRATLLVQIPSAQPLDVWPVGWFVHCLHSLSSSINDARKFRPLSPIYSATVEHGTSSFLMTESS